MNELTHLEARKRMQAACDRLLNATEQAQFEAHLQTCATCRAEWNQLQAREKRLGRVLRAGFASIPEPSANILGKIQVQNRRNQLMTRTQTIFATLAVTAALALAIFLFSSLIPEIKKSPAVTPPVTTTPAPESTPAAPELPALTEFATGKTNGGWIAFWTTSRKQDGNGFIDTIEDIYLVHPDGSDLRKQVPGGYLLSSTANAWSPNGRYLFLQNDRDSVIWDSQTDETIPVLADIFGLTTQSGLQREFFSWSPDSSRLAFTSGEYSDTRAGSDLYLIDPQGKNVQKLTDQWGFEFNPIWSTDGKRIIYFNTTRARPEYEVGDFFVYEIDLGQQPASKPRLLSEGTAANIFSFVSQTDRLYLANRSLTCPGCNPNKEGLYEIPLGSETQEPRQRFVIGKDDPFLNEREAFNWMYEKNGKIYFSLYTGEDLFARQEKKTWDWLELDGESVRRVGQVDLRQLCPDVVDSLDTDSNPPELLLPNPQFGLVTCEGKSKPFLIQHDAPDAGAFIRPLAVSLNGLLPVAWSPDGLQLLLVRHLDDGGSELYRADLAQLLDPSGEFQPQLLAHTPGKIQTKPGAVIWQP